MQRCVKGLNKELFRPISLALLLALVLTSIGPMVAQADPGWYDASWSYRKKITIDHTKVSANLNYFPVLISLSSDTDLANDAQDDGDDILFTSSDGVSQLSHEIEKFVSNTGELVAWVKVPALSSTTDTDIYMYYGHAGAGNQENATNVWDSNYKMVQHLEETTPGGANAIKDSTVNTNHGTDTNGPTLGATGKIDNAISFDGSDDYVDCGTSTSLSITSNITIEAWIYANSATGEYIYAKRGGSNGEVSYLVRDSTKLQIYFETSTVDDGTGYFSVPNYFNAWHHFVAVAESGNYAKLYMDGSLVATKSTAQTWSAHSSVPSFIGARYDETDGKKFLFDGLIDEIRISDTVRSGDWISTSYNNQEYPDKAVHGAAGFFTLGAEGAGAPVAIGGIVYPVNKARVLLPWLFLFSVLSLAIVRGAFHLRKSA